MHVHTSHRCSKRLPFTLCLWQQADRNSWCSSQHFIAIAQNASFHVGREQLHAIPSTMFHSSCRQVENVFTKNGIHTLTDVVITTPMNEFTSLILSNPRIYCLWNNSIQKMNYCDWHPSNQFLPLAIEVFGCLNKQVDVFVHDYGNALWNFKGLVGLPLFF